MVSARPCSVRRCLVGLLCLPLMMLAACGDKDSKTDEPTPSASVSGSASVGETARPEDQPATDFAPDAFARLWIKLYSEATTSGETDRLRLLSLKSCEVCEFLLNDIDDIYEAGGEIVPQGAAHKVLSARPAVAGPDGKTRVQLSVLTAGATVTTRKGAEPKKFEEVTRTWDFVLVKKQGMWRVSQGSAQ